MRPATSKATAIGLVSGVLSDAAEGVKLAEVAGVTAAGWFDAVACGVARTGAALVWAELTAEALFVTGAEPSTGAVGPLVEEVADG
jgi:hypothetical protein